MRKLCAWVVIGLWTSERRPTLVLSMQGAVATAPAKRVRLGVALTIEVVHRRMGEGMRWREGVE